jgi:hypothetical protein
MENYDLRFRIYDLSIVYCLLIYVQSTEDCHNYLQNI